MSLFVDYTTLTSNMEASPTYHRWCSLSLLSHAIGRKVWFDWGSVGTVYCNLYVVLVGAPGTKKSTCLRQVKSFIRGLGDIETTGDSMTREAICQLMADDTSNCSKSFQYEGKPHKYSQLSVLSNELINLINSGGNPIGMIDFFTDIWDTEQFRNLTKGKGKDIIDHPYVSILGCLTPSTIKNLNAQRVVSGGMIRRCVFIKAERAMNPQYMPIVTPEQQEATLRIFDHLKKLRGVVGRVTVTPEGDRKMKEVYDKNFFRKQKITDEVFAYFLETKMELVMKLAMLLGLGKYPPSLIVDAVEIETADALISSIEQAGSQLFGSTGRNELSPISQQLLEDLQEHPEPVKRSFLYQKFRPNASVAEIDDVIASLELTNEAKVFQVTQSGNIITLVSTPKKADEYVAKLKAGKGPPPTGSQ